MCMRDSKEVEAGKEDWAVVRKGLGGHPQVLTLIILQAMVSCWKYVCKGVICFSQAFLKV